MGDAEFQNAKNCDSICWVSGVNTAPNVNFKSMTSGWGLFNGCTLDEQSVLRVLKSVPNRAELGLTTVDLYIGGPKNWSNSEEIAALLQTNVPIRSGRYSYNGWSVVC